MKIEAIQGWLPIIEPSTLSDGSKGFFAYHPYIPSVTAHGETFDEAAENWREALELYREHCKEFDLPEPTYTYMKVIVRKNESKEQTASDAESGVTATATNSALLLA